MTAAAAHDGLTEVTALATTLAGRVAAGARFAGLFGTAIPAGPARAGGTRPPYGTMQDRREEGALLVSAHLAANGELDTVEAVVPAGVSTYPAVTRLVGAAFWYERELHDAFGVVPEGHPRLEPLILPLIGSGLSPLVPARVTDGALAKPWVLGPVFPGFSVLSPSWLWIMMPALLVVVIALTLLAAGRRMLRVRRVPAWRSATAGVEGADQYTAFGYTNPTRRVLAGILLTRTELRSIEEPADTGGEPGAAPVPHLGYTSDVLELVEEFLYRPLARPMMALVRAAKRLQSGRLDAYLAYMLVALIAILAVVTALG